MPNPQEDAKRGWPEDNSRSNSMSSPTNAVLSKSLTERNRSARLLHRPIGIDQIRLVFSNEIGICKRSALGGTKPVEHFPHIGELRVRETAPVVPDYHAFNITLFADT